MAISDKSAMTVLRMLIGRSDATNEEVLKDMMVRDGWYQRGKILGDHNTTLMAALVLKEETK